MKVNIDQVHENMKAEGTKILPRLFGLNPPPEHTDCDCNKWNPVKIQLTGGKNSTILVDDLILRSNCHKCPHFDSSR